MGGKEQGWRAAVLETAELTWGFGRVWPGPALEGTFETVCLVV